MEKLVNLLEWQTVYYHQRALDRKKAVFSKVNTDYHEIDGISSAVPPFPEIIEKYWKICQREENPHGLYLNHCVATFFPKGNNSILPKEEDVQHLEERVELLP